jgi:MFS family permease
LREIIEPFINLVKAPRALWGINVSYFIEGLAYFGILTILGKYLSENAGLLDLHAGWVYSGFTGGITFAMFFLGGFSDRIGVRVALILSLSLMVVGRLFIAASGTLGLNGGVGSGMFFMIVGGLFVVLVGYGMYQPAAYAGIKKFTDKKTATMGYAMIYALMNLGAFVSGIISPPIRRAFEDKYPPNGLTAVFWVYVGMTVLAVVVLAILLTKKTEENAIQSAKVKNNASVENKPANVADRRKINNLPLIIYAVLVLVSLALALTVLQNVAGIWLQVRWLPVVVFTLAAIAEFLRQRPEHPFWNKQFVFFIFILIPVQTLFAHNWLTIPYYIDRAFHGTTVGANFEFFSNLNPILIFILTPMVAAATARVHVYKMMVYGTLVMALPTFLLALGPNPALLLTYIVVMSIGEAMWQPRFLQWVAEIAPEGQTGAYMGIAQFPWFLTKVVTGLYSGYILSVYCPKPETGLMLNTEFMWFLYSIIAMCSPIALLLARNWMLKSKGSKMAG